MTERETDVDDYRDMQREWRAEIRDIPYPGEETNTAPVSRWDDNNDCTYCGHNWTAHKNGETAANSGCGVIQPGLACRCPYSRSES